MNELYCVGYPAALTSVHLRQDRLEVGDHLVERVRPAEEVAELLGALLLGLEQIVELEPELAREVADRAVAGVDELTAVLVDLTVGEVAATREAAPPDPARGLVDIRDQAGLPQPVGAGQAREAGADDGDPNVTIRPPCRACEPPEHRRADDGGARTLDEAAPRRTELSVRDPCDRVFNDIR